MPISPENRKRYPADWKDISRRIRNEANWQCEWCGAVDNRPNPATGSRVILTVAHLNHKPEDNRRENLVALCQRCHNRYDMPHRVTKRKENKARAEREQAIAAGQLDLFK